MTLSITLLNGRPADAEDLAPLAFAGYAHFTAMQIRDRRVRGLDLHLARLRDASDELFGHHLPDEAIIQQMHTALAKAPPDVSLTCYITSRPGQLAHANGTVDLDVLIKVIDPAKPPTGPLTLDPVEHERHLPHVKHVDEVSKTLLLKRANARGFDDAVFTDRSGRLSEATIWNLALWDGRSVIWPQAEILPGVTMQILARRLRALGISQQTQKVHRSELGEHLAAALMNSWTPGITIAQIGDQALAQEPEFVRILHAAYAGEPLVAV
ncbi:Branched-chain amino acid aminotransferase/4-amino-4-deoxychorismate lyase [Brevibacterium sandarakinum]|uniref:Branched-chain amino acid aminotransferase/4-amino-4-deoxychorismate lyase n=1 Tax=Brevibacterium sandarakinum TaxID=629680 RepID=A0A1H1XE07_BRESA|nr:aminotransferase class IV family protein [Brevibacterium sandarakinum]SDT07351.1 Branched-chain amino acid aminotransferase/4-amino-4-deoxychorismate lyase [Brevibacterium sandarakinum]